MTYTEAIKTPARGWKYADDEQMMAALCENLGRTCCLNPSQIFDWAKKRDMDYPTLRQEAPQLSEHPADMVLLVAVLNDQPLEVPNDA